MSSRFTLNANDLKTWLNHNLLPSAAPIFLVGLIAFQQGIDWKVASTMMWTATLTTLIDLTRRFISKGT